MFDALGNLAEVGSNGDCDASTPGFRPLSLKTTGRKPAEFGGPRRPGGLGPLGAPVALKAIFKARLLPYRAPDDARLWAIWMVLLIGGIAFVLLR
jgi:hypothetical protein